MKGSFFSLFVSLLLNIVRQLTKCKWWRWQTTFSWDRESVLRLLGIRFGHTPTTVIRDGSAMVEALVLHADIFSDRHVNGNVGAVLTTVPYGPHWVALRRNLMSEAFHPVRGLVRAAPHRARALSALIADITTRSSSGAGVVPVRDCLYAALFALNVGTCFGNDVDGEHINAMLVAQQELLRFTPTFRVFITFQQVAKLFFWDRWKQMVQCRRRQEELYLPLIRACQERRCAGNNDPTATSYVDTLIDLEVPTEGDAHQQQRKLSDGEMVGLVSEYLGASTGTILSVLEWTLANLVLKPDIQSRLRNEIEAAGGEDCAYLRAVVMESLRRHPPIPLLQRLMRSDMLVGGTPVAQGSLVIFSLNRFGRDGKIWTSPDEFNPDRFMPGGEGAGVRLTTGTKDTTSVKIMPFGAGPRICPGVGYALTIIEYFLANLVTTFEWHAAKGEVVGVSSEQYGFFVVMRNPLVAQVVPLTSLDAIPK